MKSGYLCSSSSPYYSGSCNLRSSSALKGAYKTKDYLAGPLSDRESLTARSKRSRIRKGSNGSIKAAKTMSKKFDFTNLAYREAVGRLKILLEESYAPLSISKPFTTQYRKHYLEDSGEDTDNQSQITDRPPLSEISKYLSPNYKAQPAKKAPAKATYSPHRSSRYSCNTEYAPPPPAPVTSEVGKAPPEIISFIEKQEDYIEQLEKESKFCRDELSSLLGKVRDVISENEALTEHAKSDLIGHNTKISASSESDDNHYSKNIRGRKDKPTSKSLSGPSIVFESRISELEAELAQANIDLKKLRSENSQLKNRSSLSLGTESASIDSYRKRVENLEREKISLQETVTKLQLTIEDLRVEGNQAASKTQRTRDLADMAIFEKSQAETEIRRLKDELERQHERVRELQHEMTRRISEERSNAERRYTYQVDQLGGDLSSQWEHASKLQLEVERQKRFENDLKRELSQKSAQIDELKQELKDKKAAFLADLAQINAEKQSLEQEITSLRLQLDRSDRQAKIEVGRLNAEITSLRQRLDRADADILQSRRENIRLNEEIANLEKDLALGELKGEIRPTTKEINKTIVDMEKKHGKTIDCPRKFDFQHNWCWPSFHDCPFVPKGFPALYDDISDSDSDPVSKVLKPCSLLFAESKEQKKRKLSTSGQSTAFQHLQDRPVAKSKTNDNRPDPQTLIQATTSTEKKQRHSTCRKSTDFRYCEKRPEYLFKTGVTRPCPQTCTQAEINKDKKPKQTTPRQSTDLVYSETRPISRFDREHTRPYSQMSMRSGTNNEKMPVQTTSKQSTAFEYAESWPASFFEPKFTKPYTRTLIRSGSSDDKDPNQMQRLSTASQLLEERLVNVSAYMKKDRQNLEETLTSNEKQQERLTSEEYTSFQNLEIQPIPMTEADISHPESQKTTFQKSEEDRISMPETDTHQAEPQTLCQPTIDSEKEQKDATLYQNTTGSDDEQKETTSKELTTFQQSEDMPVPLSETDAVQLGSQTFKQTVSGTSENRTVTVSKDNVMRLELNIKLVPKPKIKPEEDTSPQLASALHQSLSTATTSQSNQIHLQETIHQSQNLVRTTTIHQLMIVPSPDQHQHLPKTIGLPSASETRTKIKTKTTENENTLNQCEPMIPSNTTQSPIAALPAYSSLNMSNNQIPMTSTTSNPINNKTTSPTSHNSTTNQITTEAMTSPMKHRNSKDRSSSTRTISQPITTNPTSRKLIFTPTTISSPSATHPLLSSQQQLFQNRCHPQEQQSTRMHQNDNPINHHPSALLQLHQHLSLPLTLDLQMQEESGSQVVVEAETAASKAAINREKAAELWGRQLHEMETEDLTFCRNSLPRQLKECQRHQFETSPLTLTDIDPYDLIPDFDISSPSLFERSEDESNRTDDTLERTIINQFP